MRLILAFLLLPACALGQERGYQRLVLLGDPHLPGSNREMKLKARADINGWSDVDSVVALGDLCEGLGTGEELLAAKEYFSGFEKPVRLIAGNHDVLYSTASGKKDLGPPAERSAKLQRSMAAFSMDSHRWSERLGPYKLVFLSVDDMESRFLSSVSTATLEWLDTDLSTDPEVPSIVFFHGPLEGTSIKSYPGAENPRFIAQPKDRIRELLRRHPQVLLWASGHAHIGATNSRFRHKVNLYDGRVLGVHVPDMDGRSFLRAGKPLVVHKELWSVSLFLYPDKVVVKTYDHGKGAWLERLTREVRPR